MLFETVHFLIGLLITFYIRSPWDSILDAVLTVSPNKQYLGIFRPTTPATHDPE